MGVINPHNANGFKSAEFVYSKVRRFLSSYDAVNLIDEGEFPTYTMDVLRELGNGAYMEDQAILYPKNFQCEVPENFGYLHALYKCSPISSNKHALTHRQNSSYSFTYSDGVKGNKCKIDCCESEGAVEKITLETFITEEKGSVHGFNNFVPLRAVGSTTSSMCSSESINLSNSSLHTFSLNNGIISTNFDEDPLYMQYFGFPIDEEGVILMPDVKAVENAVYWYMIWQILLGTWFNSTVPDIQNKWQYAEQQYNKWFITAKNYFKTPSFATMVDMIRRTRSNSKLVLFTKQHSNTNFQRIR